MTETVYVGKGSSHWHADPDCYHLTDSTVTDVAQDEAERAGQQPCMDCSTAEPTLAQAVQWGKNTSN